MGCVSILLVSVIFCWAHCYGLDTGHCGNFSVKRKQENKGFHRIITTDLEWEVGVSNVSNCQFLIFESIPRGLYVDLDEIQNRANMGGPKVFCENKINTELLAHKANSHQIFVYPRTQLTIKDHQVHSQCVLPVHLRYHQPQLGNGFATVTLQPPKVLVKCNGNFQKVGCDLQAAQAFCDAEGVSVCSWLILSSPVKHEHPPAELLVFRVPVGLEEHGVPVAVVTLFITTGGCLLVVFRMWIR